MKKVFGLILLLASLASGQVVIQGQGGIGLSGNLSMSSAGTIATPVTVTGPTCPLPHGTEAGPYSQTFTAGSGTAPYTFSTSSALPTGVALASNGNLAGTPAIGSNGVYNLSIVAADALGGHSTPYACQLTIDPVPAGSLSITTNSPLSTCVVGIACSQPLTATGGTPPYTWTVPAGTIPAGAVDILTWMSMGYPDVLSNHLSGGATPKYSLIQAGVLWEIKGSKGNPWDVRFYDDSFTYQVYTDNNDSDQQAACTSDIDPTTGQPYTSCFSDPKAYKQIVTPRPFTPRYFVPGSTVTILTPPTLTGGSQVNPYIKTTNCGLDNQPVAYLGNVKTVTSGGLGMPAGISTWGGDVGVKPTIETDYYYSGNVSGVYQNRERFYFVFGWGWVSWDHAALSGGVYVVDQGSTNNQKVSGGTPAPNFPCQIPNFTTPGNLPPGTLQSNGPSFNMDAGTGVISGVGNTAGLYSFTAQVEDSIGLLAQKNFQITVNAATTCGPPAYPCTRTDLANAAPPVPIPNIGNLTGFNTAVTPAGYNNNQIIRVTDTQAITPNHHGTFWINCGGSSEQMGMNLDDTLFTVQDEGCNTFPIAFNSTTNAASKIYPSLFPSSAYSFGNNAFWSRSDRKILYDASLTAPIIEQRDFTDWLTGPKTTPPSPTTVFDFRTPFGSQHNCLPASFTVPSGTMSLGGSTPNNTLAMVYSSTVGQGSSGMVFVVAYVPGKGCAMWRTDTGAVTTDPGFAGGAGLTCTANGCSGTINTPADRFTVHLTKAGINNNWLVVVGTTCLTGTCVSGFPDGPYLWQIGTTTVAWCGQGGKCGGHDAIGTNTWFNNPGSNHIWQDATRPIAFNATPTLTIPLTSFPTMPNSSAGLGITDAHFSWNNADASDTFNVFWNSYAHPSGRSANNWGSCAVPSGATQVRQFAINGRTGAFYLADRASGFWVSTDKCATWTQRNSGLTTTFGWSVNYDIVRNQVILGTWSSGGATTAFYHSSDDGVTWTKFTLPSNTTSGWPAYNGAATVAPNGDLLLGFTHGNAGSGGLAHSSNGTTFTQSVVAANGTCSPVPGGAWSILSDPIHGNVWLGTEQCGLYLSTDNGANFAPCSPPETGLTGSTGLPGIRDGNVDNIAVDAAGDVFMATQGGLWKASPASCPLNFNQVFANSNTSEGRTVYIDSTGALYYGHKQDTHAPVCPPSCTAPVSNAGTTTVYESLDNGSTWAADSTGLPTLLEAWGFLENPFDHQTYVYMQNPTGSAGTVSATIQGAGTLAPYGWQNEVLATSPVNGTTLRFAPTFNTTLSQFFQTQIGSNTVSQDGKYALFNSDWFGQLGSESGNVLCTLGNNCRGDVFIIPLR